MKKKIIPLFSMLLLLILALAACGKKPTPAPQPTAAPTESPATEATTPSAASGEASYQVKEDCFVDLSKLNYAGKMECGVLTVPMDHARPDGPTIGLGVIRFFPTGDAPQPDPVVMLQGGPGGSFIELLPYAVGMSWFKDANKDRELIFIDQRGTRYTEPPLFCNEYGTARLQAVLDNKFREEAVPMEAEALVKCAQNAQSQGVDVAAFNSLQNAADIKDLRDALGFDKINIYGVSYGTLLTQHIMRDYPEMLRSVVLDGIFPLGQAWVKGMGQYKTDAYNRFVQSCVQDDACNQTYPDMDQFIPALYAQLEQKPAAITLTSSVDGQSVQAPLDGDLMMTILMNAIYRTSFYDDLLAGLKMAGEGNYAFFQQQAASAITLPDLAIIMHFSTVCEESADFTMDEVGVDQAPEMLQGYVEMNSKVYLDVCGQLKLPTLPEKALQPLQSDLPVLALSGAFDPATPVTWLDNILPGLPNAHSLINPAGGHGQLSLSQDDACIAGIFTSFLNDPASEPDGSCLKDETLPY